MSKTTAVPAPGEVLTQRQTITVMVGLMLGMFLSSLDQTIVSTSIYTIANDLDGLSLQAWATTAYLITSTVSTPLYGKLSDIFGRRPLYLAAILIFLAGSLYAGSVHSMTELAIARGIQGMGAGGLLALALTIIGDIVALKDRAKFQGYFMSVFGISSVLGPVVGGAFAGSANILGFDGWRWVFFINLPDRPRRPGRGVPVPAPARQAREAEDRLLGRRRHHPGHRSAAARGRTGPQLGLDLGELLPLLRPGRRGHHRVPAGREARRRLRPDPAPALPEHHLRAVLAAELHHRHRHVRRHRDAPDVPAAGQGPHPHRGRPDDDHLHGGHPDRLHHRRPDHLGVGHLPDLPHPGHRHPDRRRRRDGLLARRGHRALGSRR